MPEPGTLLLASRKSQYESEIGPRREFDPDAPIEKGKLLRMSISEMKECPDEGDPGGDKEAISATFQIPYIYSFLKGATIPNFPIGASALKGSDSIIVNVGKAAIDGLSVFEKPSYFYKSGIGSISGGETAVVQGFVGVNLEESYEQSFTVWPMQHSFTSGIGLVYEASIESSFGGYGQSTNSLTSVSIHLAGGSVYCNMSYSMIARYSRPDDYLSLPTVVDGTNSFSFSLSAFRE